MAQERLVYIERRDGSKTEVKSIESVSDVDAIRAYEEITGLTSGVAEHFMVACVPPIGELIRDVMGE